MVRWLDASDIKAQLSEHEASPEAYCKDWGVYLGCSGRKKRLLIIGKDVVEVHNKWGATRIPLNLVEEVILILTRDEMMKAVREVQILGRRVSLRRYKRKEERSSDQAPPGEPLRKPAARPAGSASRRSSRATGSSSSSDSWCCSS